jgi:hypothetical protein
MKGPITLAAVLLVAAPALRAETFDFDGVAEASQHEDLRQTVRDLKGYEKPKAPEAAPLEKPPFCPGPLAPIDKHPQPDAVVSNGFVYINMPDDLRDAITTTSGTPGAPDYVAYIDGIPVKPVVNRIKTMDDVLSTVTRDGINGEAMIGKDDLAALQALGAKPDANGHIEGRRFLRVELKLMKGTGVKIGVTTGKQHVFVLKNILVL